MASDKDDKKGRKGSKGLTRDDVALWRQFTHDIDPLHEIDWPALEEQAQGKAPAQAPSETPVINVSTRSAPMGKPQDTQLDRRTEEKLRKGKMEIDARLDLHGFSQERAYEALQGFIARAHQAGLRCVLVITGKGKSGVNDREEWVFNDGVLRQRVPEWLSLPPLSAIALRYFLAQPKDGGDGAYYVYLRRVRDYQP